MRNTIRVLAISAATGGLALAGACYARPDSGSPADIEAMAGMWQVSPRGPGGPPGAGRGGGRFGPPQGGAQRGGANFGEGGGLGPPPGSPEGSADDLPGPDIEGLDRGDRMTWAMMTAKGKAAFEAMDPHDLPANNCLSNGLPSLVGIPDVQDWSFDGDLLTIHYANFDTVRTVHLDGSAPSGPPSLYGYSSGVIADGELTITTTNLIATPGGLGRNAPGSAARSYVEHYTLAADGRSITGWLTIHDPEYLTRDITRPIAFARAAEGTVIPDDVGCSVEASQRYLDG